MAKSTLCFYKLLYFPNLSDHSHAVNQSVIFSVINVKDGFHIVIRCFASPNFAKQGFCSVSGPNNNCGRALPELLK